MAKILQGLMLIIFVWCSSGHVSAQSNTRVETLSQEEGLPSREVNAITQDKRGLMWLGTPQGLVRYDGQEFTLYNTDENNSYHLPEEIIYKLLYTPKTDSLWIVANWRLIQFNTVDNGYTTYSEKQGLRGDVITIHLDHQGTLYLVTDDLKSAKPDEAKQYLQVYKNGYFHVIDEVKRGVSWFTGLSSDRNNHIFWTTIKNGISHYSDQGQFIESIIPDSYNWFGTYIHFIPSYFDQDNNHYIFRKSNGGISKLHTPYDKKEQERILDIPGNIYFATEDKNNAVWFAGATGLHKMTSENKIQDFSDLIQSSLAYTKINTLFVDAMGLIWLGTDGGAIKIRDKQSLFDHLFVDTPGEWGNSMRGIVLLEDGRIIAKHANGSKLLLWSPDGQETEFTFSETYEGGAPLFQASHFILSSDKKALYTVGETLLKINLQNGTVKEYPKIRAHIHKTHHIPLIRLSDGRFVFGQSIQRLIVFDPKTEQFELPFYKSYGEKNATLLSLEESTQNNTLWAGTIAEGILKLNLSGKIEAHYHSSSKPRINNLKILSLHEDKKKGLWIGTYGGGLQYLNPDGNSIIRYNKNHGLPSNNITAILPYEDYGYWISSYNGLSFFDTEKQLFQNFFVEDGLSHNEFNYSSFLKTEDGQYYFGGMNGINRFRPENVLAKHELPALRLTKIDHLHSDPDKTLQRDIAQKQIDELIISPGELYTTFHWSMPSYFNSRKHNYYTKLKGYEDQWQFNGSDPRVRYNQLPAGKYTLQVKGLDSNGNESTGNINLDIIVHQVFYKRWWFITILLMLLSSLIYGIFQFRLRQVLAMERLRTKISSDLHDDIGSMLSGLAMQTELLQINASDKNKPRLTKVARISRDAVSQMRDLVWSIDSRRETIADLLERMQELAEELLLPMNIKFTLESRGIKNLNKKLPYQTKQNIFLIYKEAINNIIKHSDASHVQIEFINDKHSCNLLIQDNGNPKESYQSSGLGLSNMKMRAETLKAQLSIKTKNGFSVYLKLPSLG